MADDILVNPLKRSLTAKDLDADGRGRCRWHAISRID
jgi:hypothetical protein